MKKKKEPRNLGITVLSGSVAVVLACIAIDSFINHESFLYGAVFALLALIATVVATYGRKSIFKKLIESIIDLPV